MSHCLNKSLEYYRRHPEQAVQFVTVGQQDAPATESSVELAAQMTVASILFNLDEAITHE